MSFHQHDENMLPDDKFFPGEPKFLVEGNMCRLLDGRRTPGFIEKYDSESAMFRWRIEKFEDQGKYWDVPAEDITRYQFAKDSKALGDKQVEEIKSRVKLYEEPLKIQSKSEARMATEKEIFNLQVEAEKWLLDDSEFLRSGEKFNFSSKRGPEKLINDLFRFMKEKELTEQEKNTSETYVLNPDSGEWFKGTKIVMAELGLQSYHGKIPRTKDIFGGAGSKELRRKHILNRLAFVRGLYSKMNLQDVTLYRGMATEGHWEPKGQRTYTSWTFHKEVAEAFASLERESRFKNSYIVKRSISVNKLFMTYQETQAMNNQYDEAEAVVLHDARDRIFW